MRRRAAVFTVRRRIRSRALCVVAVIAALALSACFPLTPLPTRSCITRSLASVADYQQLFDVRATEAAAADIWSPTAIGGRVVWFLGDTYVGRQQPRGKLAPGYYSVHNAVQSQSGGCLDTLMAGTPGHRTDWFTQPSSTSYFWPAGTYVDNGVLNLFLYLVRRVDRAGEGFDFYVAGMRVAKLQSGNRAVSITRPPDLPDTSSPSQLNIPYGGSVAEDDQYVYMYGAITTSQYNSSNYVARAPAADVASGHWEFWDGVAWSTTPSAAKPMSFLNGEGTEVGGPGLSQLHVTPYGAGWVGVSKRIDGYTDDVTAWFSSSPQGPWQLLPTPDGDGEIATTPTADPDDLAYGASLVNLPGAGWVVMWNVNSLPNSNVAANIWRYGPKFAAPSNLPAPEVLFSPGP
jgi:hypothetical protein